MRVRRLGVLVISVSLGTGLAFAGCPGKPLSNKAVKRLVDHARAARSDLPAAFIPATWEIQKRGCYYVYVEHEVPATPEGLQTVTLNPAGTIVDATISNSSKSPLHCPDKIFSERDLAMIINSERSKQSTLPAPFPTTEIRSTRSRCLYEYFEYAIPSIKGMYHLFTLDPMGHLMDVSQGTPQNLPGKK